MVKVDKINGACADKPISVKAVTSCIVVALAVLAPQIVHIFAGAQGGSRWLPMYLPVLMGACLLGRRWGLGIALSAPLISFIITSVAGNAMPAAGRLPYMMAELAVFATVSGAFSDKIRHSAFAVFVAVISAQIAGRAVYLLLTAIFNLGALSSALSQIKIGVSGLTVQMVLVPLIVIIFSRLENRENARD